MYTTDKNSKPNATNVKEAIDHNEESRNYYDKMARYYDGDHEIKYREKGVQYKNNQVVINNARYITDINVGFLLGNEIEYQTDENYDLTSVTKEYREQTISLIDLKLANALSKFGITYERIYADGNKPRSAVIDPRNCVIAYDDTVKHAPLFAVLYEKGKPNSDYKSITVITKNEEIGFWDGKKIAKGAIVKNVIGDIPVVEYNNSEDRKGDYYPVIGLIDAYNLLTSDRVNDKEQLVESILLMYGYALTDDLRDALIKFRTMDNLPLDAKTEYLSKVLNETQIEILRLALEADIHKISMTPNLSDTNFVGNASGVAIAYKIIPFMNKGVNKERFFEKGLRDRFQIYNTYLTKINKSKLVPVSEIKVVFKKNLPKNDLETSQIASNLSGKVSDQTLIGQLSFVSDAAKEIETAQKESLEKANLESPQYGTGNTDLGNQDNLNTNQNDTSNL